MMHVPVTIPDILTVINVKPHEKCTRNSLQWLVAMQ